MGVLNTMIQFFTGHRHKQDAEQAEISRAIAFQTAKGDVLRTQLAKEINGLRDSEARMHDYFGTLQMNAGRNKRGAN